MVVGGCNGNFQSPIPLRSNGPETVVDNTNTVAVHYSYGIIVMAPTARRPSSTTRTPSPYITVMAV